ncbi:MAG: hypothetical protein B7Y99_02900 [Caulobacterales bacterium 32-69-10]|nr:MAG: hypothetical protein B7Y99_02900 [Caulobacterales bacterium 32-69-10]
MRHILIATSALLGLCAVAPAAAQVDRYGGVGTYAQPVPQQPQSSRVLTWTGKTIPPQSPPQAGGYGYPRYVQARPAYGAQLQPAPYAQSRGAPPAPYAVERRATMYPQARPPQYAPQYGYAPQPQAAAPQQPMTPYGYAAQMPPPQQPYYAPQAPQPPQPPQAPQAPQQAQATFTQPFQPQPYFAPAPGAPMAAPGSTATAPSGVYPTNTVPPQLAGPGSLPPQVAQPLVNNPQALSPQGMPPAPPTSIYAPPPQARISEPTPLPNAQPDPTDPREPQRVAMMSAAQPQTARYYSLHRQFGLRPDPTPAPVSDADAQSVELVSSIDSGVGGEPSSEPRNRVVRTNGKTGTAILRGARDADPDDN